MSLPGVGRKTANVMIAVAFGGNAFAVDTHVFRLSHRLGLSNGNTPEEVENDLCAAFPVSSWAKAHHLLIHHGRYLCRARNPECERCLLSDICVYFGQNKERAVYSPLE